MSDFIRQRLVQLSWRVDDRRQHRRLPAAAVASPAAARAWRAPTTRTGHVWDEDLREMNNPLPRWWVWLFVLTIVFGLRLPGRLPGPRQLRRRAGLEQRAASTTPTRSHRRQGRLAPLYAPLSTARQPEALSQDAKAMAIGERLFMNNCAQCHGSDARGSKGFPNLTDTDWLHGGTPDKIKETITNGRHRR